MHCKTCVKLRYELCNIQKLFSCKSGSYSVSVGIKETFLNNMDICSRWKA